MVVLIEVETTSRLSMFNVCCSTLYARWSLVLFNVRMYKKEKKLKNIFIFEQVLNKIAACYLVSL